MDSVFIEQLVKHNYTKADNRKRIIILIITALLVFIWMHMQFLPAIIMMVALTLVIAYFTMNFLLNTEFEYSFTDGELDIDKIYNKSRRRRVFTGLVREFEVLAHFNDKGNLDFYKNFKLKDYSGGLVTGNTYVFVTSYKGKKYRFAIEPNDEMLEALRRSITPGKFFRKKTTEEKL